METSQTSKLIKSRIKITHIYYAFLIIVLLLIAFSDTLKLSKLQIMLFPSHFESSLLSENIRSAKVYKLEEIQQQEMLIPIPKRFYLLAMIKSNAARYQGVFGDVPRTVIVHIDPSKSECEIVYHVLSTFLFGIVSDRLILIDWSSTKIFPQSFMDQYDFNNAPSKYSLPIQKWMDQAVNVNAYNIIKKGKLLRPDNILNKKVLAVSGSDWWAHGLFSSNLYPSQLEGLNPNRAFDILTAYAGINAAACTQPPYNVSISPFIPYTKIDVKGAIVYLNYNSEKPEDLARSIGDLYSTFIQYYDYPIVLLVANKKDYYYLRWKFPKIRIIIDEVDPNQWAVNLPEGTYPEIWSADGDPPTIGKYKIGWRQMSRYAAGFLFNHRALSQFDYVIKLDPDTYSSRKWDGDPFQRMLDKKIGYWAGLEDSPFVTKNLGETIKQFLKEYDLKLKHPEMIFDKDGNYRSSTYYGCFIGMATSVTRSQKYQELFAYLDSKGGWFRYRWDEQKLFTLYAALYLEKHEIEYFSYVGVEHQDQKQPKYFGP